MQQGDLEARERRGPGAVGGRQKRALQSRKAPLPIAMNLMMMNVRENSPPKMNRIPEQVPTTHLP